jgi:hypothetical protein
MHCPWGSILARLGIHYRQPNILDSGALPTFEGIEIFHNYCGHMWLEDNSKIKMRSIS